MGIITGGYDGTIDEVQFAGMFHRYSVVGPNDFKATTQAGDRIVSIGNGTALGPGTRDVATNLPTIQFTAAPTNTTRWDLVVLRRDWQPPGGVSEIKIIEGGTSEAYPTVGTALNQWNRRPGIMDDQPLYLQQVNGTLLGTRIDLRCWDAHGGLVAAHDKARTYLERPGAEVLIGGVKWTYVPGANGVAEWQSRTLDRSINGGAHVGLTALKTGWTRPFTAGNFKPRVWSTDGITAHVTGLVKFNAGAGADIIGIPTEFSPAEGDPETIIGTTQASDGASSTVSGAVLTLGIKNGVLKIVYQSKTVAIGSNVPLTGTWRISG